MSSPDFWSMIAVERGMPEGWRWYALNVLGDHGVPREHAAALVTGAVPGARFAKGKRKGEIDWSKATSPAEIVVTFADYDARALRWESQTGKCKDCGGETQKWAGWSKAEGHRTKPCGRCNSTGTAPAKEAA